MAGMGGRAGMVGKEGRDVKARMAEINRIKLSLLPSLLSPLPPSLSFPPPPSLPTPSPTLLPSLIPLPPSFHPCHHPLPPLPR